MKSLITISNNKQVVNARELHAFLGSKQDFSNWIKNRINKYGFVENQDFEVFNNFIENSNGGRPSIEYALTMDMAKELSMVENNEKGKTARRYFIECEKQFFSSAKLELPHSAEIRQLPMDISIKERRKQTQIELIKTIKLNLFKGDLKHLAQREGISYNKVVNVMASKVFDYDIIYVLYEKARENLMILDTEIKTLNDDLKSLAV